MAVTNPIFTKGDLEDYLQRRHDEDPVDGIPDDVSTGIPQGTYEVIHRMVCSWLIDATGLPQLPGDSDRVWAWALELAALTVENATSAASMTTDRVGKTWTTNSIKRRDTILDRARQWGAGLIVAPVVPAPTGSFPTPEAIPTDLLRFPRHWPRLD